LSNNGWPPVTTTYTLRSWFKPCKELFCSRLKISCRDLLEDYSHNIFEKAAGLFWPRVVLGRVAALIPYDNDDDRKSAKALYEYAQEFDRLIGATKDAHDEANQRLRITEAIQAAHTAGINVAATINKSVEAYKQLSREGMKRAMVDNNVLSEFDAILGGLKAASEAKLRTQK
jgi:hypothetical protein